MSRVGFLKDGAENLAAGSSAAIPPGALMHVSRTTEGMRRTAAAFSDALKDAYVCACKFGSGSSLTHDSMMRFFSSLGVFSEPGKDQALLLFMGSTLPQLDRLDVVRLFSAVQAPSATPTSASHCRPSSAKAAHCEFNSNNITFQNFVDVVLLVCDALLVQLNLQVYMVNGDISQHLSLCLNSFLSAALGHDVQPQQQLAVGDDTGCERSALSSIQRFPPHLVSRVMAVLRNGSFDNFVTIYNLRACASQLPLQPPLDDTTLTNMFEEAAGGGDRLTQHHLTIATSMQFKYRRHTQHWRRLFEAVIRAKALAVTAAPQPVPLLNLQKIASAAPPPPVQLLQRKMTASLMNSGFRMRPAGAPRCAPFFLLPLPQIIFHPTELPFSLLH
jgi:hypothetical protein